MQEVLDVIHHLGPTQSINVLFTIGGFFAALYLLSWQIRIHASDKQQWAAFALIGSLALILAQLAWSNLGGLPMRDSVRGNLTYLFVMASLIWLALETRNINLRILKARKAREERVARMEAQERMSAAREVAVTGREHVATDREDMATGREGAAATREGAVAVREVAATERETK
jgi:hypothetical protein